jgi:CheY-like chemotaxis protein/anti-sigma regulatory factor (Ser/Thr protein kinase)
MIVNDVLDFSRIEEGKLELTMVEFDLVRLIETSFKIVLGSAVAKNLDVRISVDDRIAPQLVGDEHRLRQILLNLLNNAIKFTQEGAVSLTVELAAQGVRGEALRFSVTDTGIGIPEGKLGQLFQRFSQVDGSTSREYGGSGLGLAISKRLVEMMGGEIGVESTPGKGSTFWILLNLPRADEQVHSPKDAPVAVSPASARLLLVEDVEINREIACAILRSIGYRIDAVSSGAEAIAAVQSSRYDLVLMDIQMPGMDGLTATRIIRALPDDVANIPIVAMTANVLPKQIESFRSAGMNDHIGKPFKRDELRATIERCLPGPRLKPPPAEIESIESAAADDEIFVMLATLLGRVKVDGLLNEFKVELERFISADAASPDLAAQAHRLVSPAGMLGFGNVSKHCSDLEQALSGCGPATTTFVEVREICISALSALSARFSPIDHTSETAAAV